MILFCIDFDKTIAVIPSGWLKNFYYSNVEKKEALLHQFLKNGHSPIGNQMQWKNVFETMIAQGHSVAIVSANISGIIPLYLKVVLGLSEETCNKIEIHICDRKYSDNYGKNIDIQAVAEKFNVSDKNKIILIDDQNCHLKRASAAGYKTIKADDKGSHLIELIKLVAVEEKCETNMDPDTQDQWIMDGIETQKYIGGSDRTPAVPPSYILDSIETAAPNGSPAEHAVSVPLAERYKRKTYSCCCGLFSYPYGEWHCTNLEPKDLASSAKLKRD